LMNTKLLLSFHPKKCFKDRLLLLKLFLAETLTSATLPGDRQGTFWDLMC